MPHAGAKSRCTCDWSAAATGASADAPTEATEAEKAAKPVADYPLFPEYQDDVYKAVADAATEDLSKALTIAGKNERNDRTDEIKAEVLGKLIGAVRLRERGWDQGLYTVIASAMVTGKLLRLSRDVRTLAQRAQRPREPFVERGSEGERPGHPAQGGGSRTVHGDRAGRRSDRCATGDRSRG